ncbi:MAG: hypothetical protein ACK5TG_19100 [Planctomyces sp.]|jgi:hypothetical protein|nr:cytochrome c [Planctomyces sp.]HAV33346.1 hypothetical protein [Planctomycetaceae bacterium]HBC63857.1 hypothetical protein [Planctomycetaceae bacterium]
MKTALITAAAAVGCLLTVLAPESSRVAWSVPAAPTDDVKPVEDSMHEFMEYVFQPTYLRLKANMAAAPTDNKGWKAIKADSLVLAESCNLLFSRAPEGSAADWIAHAKASREKGAALYAAGKAKDFAAAGTAWKSMLESCNACHRQFEYGKHILQP